MRGLIVGFMGVVAAAMLLVPATAQAGLIVQYTFSPTTTSGPPAPGYNPTTYNAGLDLTQDMGITTGAGLKATLPQTGISWYSAPILQTQPQGGSGSVGTLPLAITNNSYWQFTISPQAGQLLNLTSLTFEGWKGGSSGTRGYGLETSVGGFGPGLTLASADFTATRVSPKPVGSDWTIDLSGAGFQNLVSPITFRVYTYSTAGTVEFDNVTLNGNLVAVPEPGTLAFLGLGTLALMIRRRRG
jgi:hypothetical protein